MLMLPHVYRLVPCFACFVAISTILGGCQFIAKSPTSTPEEVSTSESVPNVSSVPIPKPSPKPVINFFQGQGNAQMLQAYKKQIGGPVFVLEVNVYKDYVILTAQDPKKLENVDSYIYRDGKLEPSIPVKLMKMGENARLEDNLFPLEESQLTNIPTLVKTTQAQLKFEGAEVTHVHIARPLPFRQDVEARVFVSGTRHDGYIDFKPSGQVLEVHKD